jgi:hypothetical protein
MKDITGKSEICSRPLLVLGLELINYGYALDEIEKLCAKDFDMLRETIGAVNMPIKQK